jgi:NAD(P)-dependent dehydrogenase (short-subunit alcohol dehydrogenase family)
MSQGSIIFTSGSLLFRPCPGTAMLPAVEGLAPALALELAPVRANAVTPSLIDTPLLHTAYGAERDTLVKNQAAILPGRCVGTADDAHPSAVPAGRVHLPLVRYAGAEDGVSSHGARRRSCKGTLGHSR